MILLAHICIVQSYDLTANRITHFQVRFRLNGTWNDVISSDMYQKMCNPIIFIYFVILTIELDQIILLKESDNFKKYNSYK